jgi:hypothetical protein
VPDRGDKEQNTAMAASHSSSLSDWPQAGAVMAAQFLALADNKTYSLLNTKGSFL